MSSQSLTTVAFDADVLIYSVVPNHPLGIKVAELLNRGDKYVFVGSVILLPEVLAKPERAGRPASELTALKTALSKLTLLGLDQTSGYLALSFAVQYGLKTADSVHLATAAVAGADYFLTNNRKDFPKTITEIDILYPDDLPIER